MLSAFSISPFNFLAKKLNGEILNADSMQIYKEFAILSSRPNEAEVKKEKNGVQQKGMTAPKRN